MNNKEFIKRFNEISISNICKELGFKAQNFYSGKASDTKLLLVAKKIEYEMQKLLLDRQYKLYLDSYESKKIEVLED